MEIAICTRCQSNNPVFTKFCLTCGLAITADMKRSVVVNPPTNAKSVVTPTGVVAATGTVATTDAITSSSQQTTTNQSQTAEAQTTQTENQPNQPQTKGAGWLKSLFSK